MIMSDNPLPHSLRMSLNVLNGLTENAGQEN